MSIHTKSEFISKRGTKNFADYLIDKYIDENLVLFQNFANEFDDFAGFHPNYSSNDFKNKIIFCDNLPAIEHDFAHFVEVDKNRYTQPDFGLGMSKDFRENKSKKVFYNSSLREERVCAIQRLILGEKEVVFENIKLVRNSAFQDKFKKLGCVGDVYKTLEEFQQVCYQEAINTFNSWSLDKVEEVFKYRINKLYENLYSIKETKLVALWIILIRLKINLLNHCPRVLLYLAMN